MFKLVNLRRGLRRPCPATRVSALFALVVGFLTLVLAPRSSLAQDGDGNDNPTGVEGVFNGNINTGNSYDPYTYCAMRDIVDLVVPGAVGERGLSFVRHWRSRLGDSGLTVFGDGNWRHDYDWAAAYNRVEQEPGEPPPPRPTVMLSYPDGRSVIFRAPAGGGGYYFPVTPGIRDSLQVNVSSGLILTQPGGAQVIFTVVPGGTTLHHDYRATSLKDRYGLSTTLSYNSSGLLEYITEPGGRYIYLHYAGVSLGSITTTTIDRIQASNGQIVKYYYIDPGTGANLPVLSVAQYDYETNNTSPFIFASYSYQTLSSGGNFAFLSHAKDPHLRGPMKNIGYAYSSGATPGELFAEAYDNNSTAPYVGTTYQWINVSWISAPTAATRTETRADGPTRTFTYGAGGFLTSILDFEGYTTSYLYDGYGYVGQVTDAEGRVTTITNNAFGKPLTITHNADGTHRDFTYASGTYLLTATNELGGVAHRTTWTRDGNNRVSRIDYPDGAFETFTYDLTHGGVLTHVLTNGTTITNTYDQLGHGGSGYGGLLTTQSGPDGNTLYSYDSFDRVNSITDVRGKITMFDYNGRHQVVKTTWPVIGAGPAAYTQKAYNNEGSVVGSWDEMGHYTSFAYDSYQRITVRIDPVSSTTTRTTHWNYHRNGYAIVAEAMPANGPAEIISPGGKYTVFDYTNNRRLATHYSGAYTADQTYVRWEYNNVGQVTRELQLLPGGTTERVNSLRHYNARGFMDWADDAATKRTSFTYDVKGNRKVVTLPSTKTITYDFYDNRDRPTQITDERGKVTLMSYYPSGSLKELTDPNTKVYKYYYDASNRKTKLVYPDTTFEQWTYGSPSGATAGLQTAYLTRDNDQQNFTSYDERGRLTQSTWSLGAAPTVDYTWDDAGRMTTISNVNSAITNVYNDIGEQIQETQTLTSAGGSQTVGYQRNDDGLVTTLTHPSTAWPGFTASTDYAYNARNQLKSVALTSYPSSPALATYTYRTDGLLDSKVFSTGVRTEYTYDSPAGRVASIHTHLPGSPDRVIGHRDYNYDAMSRIAYFKKGTNNGSNPMENGHGDEFFYDEAGQLWGAYYDGDTNIDGLFTTVPAHARTDYFQYDPAGNRTSSGTDVYTVDATKGDNRYSSIGGFGSVTYDGRGNLKALGTGLTNCTYDAQNRLISASSGGAVRNFYYDPLGRCVQRTYQLGATVTTVFRYYSGWNLIGEYSGGAWTSLYFHGARTDEMIAWWNSSSGWRYFHHDAQGSVTHVTDNSGTLLEQYAYDAFGKPWFYGPSGTPLSASAINNRILFTGRDWIPDLGLYDYRNRFYHPGIGRFLQTDPISFDGGDGNLYRYCGNDPVNRKDPSGLQVIVPPYTAQQATAQYWQDRSAALGTMPNGTYAIGFVSSVAPGGIVIVGRYIDFTGMRADAMAGRADAFDRNRGTFLTTGVGVGLEATFIGVTASYSTASMGGVTINSNVTAGPASVGLEFSSSGDLQGFSLGLGLGPFPSGFSITTVYTRAWSDSMPPPVRNAPVPSVPNIDGISIRTGVGSGATQQAFDNWVRDNAGGIPSGSLPGLSSPQSGGGVYVGDDARQLL